MHMNPEQALEIVSETDVGRVRSPIMAGSLVIIMC